MNPPFYIHASLPTGEQHTFTIAEPKPDGLILGRARAADIRLFHQTVSGSHARLSETDSGNWVLEDLGSRNGLLVAGARVKTITVIDGATAELGNFAIRFSTSPTPAAAHNPHPPQQTLNTQHVDISRLGERDAIATTRQRVTQIANAGRRLRDIDDDQQRHAELCNLVITPDLLAAWSAFVLNVNTETQSVKTIASARQSAAPQAVLDYISQSLVNAITHDPAPALGRTHAIASGELNLSIAPGATQLSAMACRLQESPNQIEVLFITLPSNRADQSSLLELAMLAEQHRSAAADASLRRQQTEIARRDTELDRARLIQQSLLPKPALTRSRNAVIHANACTEVGGDYADVIPLSDSRTLLVVADVAGKGLHAAIVAAQIHSLCRFSHNPSDPLTDLAARLNALMSSHIESALFATAIFAIHDRDQSTLELLNAGHPPALLAEPGKETRALAANPAPPLGIIDTLPQPSTHTITQGQSLLLYTDGLSELPTAPDTLLGVDGLIELFTKHAATTDPLDQRAQALVTALAQASPPNLPQHDDETFLLATL